MATPLICPRKKEFVGFALMPGPVRNEKQFELPNNFCKIDVTILSRMSRPASSFPVVFNA